MTNNLSTHPIPAVRLRHQPTPLTMAPYLNAEPAPVRPLRVAGYARVSTDLQREKETIRTQIELIERYCAEKGYVLVQIFEDDGVSGTTRFNERGGGGCLVANAAQRKFEAVVVYKADRIGRDVFVNETVARILYDEMGIPLLGVAEQIDLSTPIGRAMFTFQSAIGRLERENTLQRSRDATLRLAREGAWLGGIVPYGYRALGKDRAARLVVSQEVDETSGLCEANIVRLMYRLSGEDGMSCIQIANKLNDMGVATSYVRDGREVKPCVVPGKRSKNLQGKWRPGRVRNILVETTYKGIHVWGKRPAKKGENPVLIERQVPAIVSPEEWMAAQLTMRRNRLFRPDIKKRPYLLRGLMKCGGCGLTYIGMVSESYQSESTKESGKESKRPYYTCNGRNVAHAPDGEGGKKCESGYIRAGVLEGLVWSQIENFINDPDAVIAELQANLCERNGRAGAASELQALKVEKLQKDEERAVLYRLFRKGGISESDLDAQLSELIEEEKTLAANIERLKKEAIRNHNQNALLVGARGLLEKLRAKLELDDSWETRRKVVEALMAGALVQPEFDPLAPRGKQRRATVEVSYRFETPELEDIAPRNGKSKAVVSGLMLTRTIEAQALATTKTSQAREAVIAVLQSEPHLKLDGVIERVKEKSGQTVSRANVSRIRAGLGLSPDNRFSKAGKVTFANRKDKTEKEEAEKAPEEVETGEAAEGME